MRGIPVFLKIYLVLSCLLVLPTENLYAENLLQIHALAVQHDAGLAVAGGKKAMGMESVPQGLAALLPSSALTMQHSAVRLQDPINDRYNTNGYTLSVQVPVFHWESIKGYEKAKKEEKRALIEYAASEQELVMRSAKLYYDALLAMDNQQFALAERESITQQLAHTKTRMEVGSAVMTDLYDAQAAFDLAETGVISADDQMYSRLEALGEVIGRPVASLSPLKEEIPLIKPDPENIDRWVQTAQEESLTLKKAALDKEIAESAAQASVAGHLPGVDVVAAHNYLDNDAPPSLMGGLTRSGSLTVQMTVPLYSGHGTTSKVRQAKAAQNMTQDAEEQTRRQVVRQTKDAYRGVLSAIAQIHATRQLLLSSQSNLDTTAASYEAGLRTMADVVASQRELFRAKRDHAHAKYGYILQSLGLKYVAGLLSSQDLQAVNTWNRD